MFILVSIEWFLYSIVSGTPPPPTNLTHAGITETNIEISWSEPIGHELFDIDGYIISHKKASDATFKAQNISKSKNLNVVLNNLESNTFYVITVHGYNDEGDGDKLKIEVSTKKSDSSCKYCECLKNRYENQRYEILYIYKHEIKYRSI